MRVEEAINLFLAEVKGRPQAYSVWNAPRCLVDMPRVPRRYARVCDCTFLRSSDGMMYVNAICIPLYLQTLERTQQWRRAKEAERMLTALMGEPVALQRRDTALEIVVGDSHGANIVTEALDLLRWMRRTRSSLRATRRLRRSVGCRWLDVLNTRQALMPYHARGVALCCDGAATRTGAVCSLRAIIDTQRRCAEREQDHWPVFQEFVLVVIAFDGTPFHKASATRCDVFLDVWHDNRTAGRASSWSTWWVFDGADDTAHLQKMDAVAGLGTQVKDLESDVFTGNNAKEYPYRAVLTGDGKAMIAGNPKKGCRCWCCSRPHAMFSTAWADEEPEQFARFGAFCPTIPPARRIGDIAHCTARVCTGLAKRLLVTASEDNVAAGRAVRAYLDELQQEAKRIPVAERFRQVSKKGHTLDITCAVMFCRSVSAHATLVALLATSMTACCCWPMSGKRIRVHLVVQQLLKALHGMHNVWRTPGAMDGATQARYAVDVHRFAECWRALGWDVPTWVHWAIVHSRSTLRRWQTFLKFSSIPSELRNQGFKQDIRHCYQGWKLSSPYMTRWGLKNAIHLDSLDWGLRLHFARKYGCDALFRLREGVRRKRPGSRCVALRGGKRLQPEWVTDDDSA